MHLLTFGKISSKFRFPELYIMLSLSFLRACCYIQFYYQLMHLLINPLNPELNLSANCWHHKLTIFTTLAG
jgi:hypothetical protein